MMVYKDIIFVNEDKPCFIDLDQTFDNKIINAEEMEWGYVHYAVTRVNDFRYLEMSLVQTY